LTEHIDPRLLSSSTRLLGRLLRRAKERNPEQYFIALLERYGELHRLSNADVGRFLGVETESAWVRLALCGHPRNKPGTFWQDVCSVAAYSGTDPDHLVVVVRDVEALKAMEGLSSVADAEARDVLAAARDAEHEELSVLTETKRPSDPSARADYGSESLPLWLDARISQAVANFWKGAGAEEPEPQHFERDALRSLPCAVIQLDHLTLVAIENWLQKSGVVYHFPCGSRLVHGCLLAYRGHGLIFIDSADTPDEQRYTLAHEIVHFLLDYYEPRQETINALGAVIVDVLDGDREPTPREALHAVLEDVSLRTYFHLMDRNGRDVRGPADGSRRQSMSDMVYAAESLADRVALEILAPSDSVIDRLLDVHPGSDSRKPDQIIELAFTVLQRDFGIPTRSASVYARTLLQAFPDNSSNGDWLGNL